MKKLYFLLLLVSFSAFSQSVGDIVVTEFMNDSDQVSDTVGEWIELYNTTSSDIDLNGWSLKDDGSNDYPFSESLIVPANSYFVIGRGPNDASNGGVNLDFSYGNNYTLGNGADEIVLLSPTAVEIDRINYGINDFPDGGPGFSISLDPNNIFDDNNVPANWCLSTSTFGDGDKGTPGAVNDACAPVCLASFGNDTTNCDASTSGTDTYSVSLSYSDAGTTTFVVTATSGTVGGDNPTTAASGEITVTGIAEGTDITITMDDTGSGGLCNLIREVTSPICVPTGSVDLELKGVMDFDVSDGKAVHVIATADIADLSVYGIGVANNGGGTDGQEYTFDAISVLSGAHILVLRDEAVMETYFTTEGYALFDHVLLDASGVISQNGNDAIELFKNASVIETFGDINASGTGTSWDYADAWAYKSTAGAMFPTGWIYGGANCSDDAETTLESSCVYPLIATLSAEQNVLENVNLYPNPVKKSEGSFLTISSNSKQKMTAKIYNVIGKMLKNITVENNQIDLANLSSGLYLIKITQENRTTTKKLLIE